MLHEKEKHFNLFERDRGGVFLEGGPGHETPEGRTATFMIRDIKRTIFGTGHQSRLEGGEKYAHKSSMNPMMRTTKEEDEKDGCEFMVSSSTSSRHAAVTRLIVPNWCVELGISGPPTTGEEYSLSPSGKSN